MRFALRTLGVLVMVNTVAGVSSAAGQSRTSAASAAQSGPTACSIIDAEELKRLTGQQDFLKKGPVPTDPSELPAGRTECEYLG